MVCFGFLVTNLRCNDGVECCIINVHFNPIPLGNRETGVTLRTVWNGLGEAESIHRKELEEVLVHIRESVPTLVVGDFNSSSHFHAPTTLSDHGLTDSFASLHEQPDATPTWRYPLRNSGEITFRIDYIFHTLHFNTTESEVIETKGSDHYLLVSTLESTPTGEVAR